jgi:plasmid maintenance system antidote protein VapI
MGMSAHALSQALCVPATRLREIVKERRSITPALRLARYLSYDLKIAKAELKGKIEREVERMAA